MIGPERAAPITGMLAAALLAGCGTTYQPRQPGRVSLVVHHAAILYTKDGHEFPVGPFSGHLPGLVADSPGAASHARTANTQLKIGVPAYLVGIGGIIVAVLALSGPAGWVTIGAGASAAGTGLGFMGAGVTHIIDAVNLHNEAVASPVDDGPHGQEEQHRSEAHRGGAGPGHPGLSGGDVPRQ